MCQGCCHNRAAWNCLVDSLSAKESTNAPLGMQRRLRLTMSHQAMQHSFQIDIEHRVRQYSDTGSVRDNSLCVESVALSCVVRPLEADTDSVKCISGELRPVK